jgi:hypothetical protein
MMTYRAVEGRLSRDVPLPFATALQNLNLLGTPLNDVSSLSHFRVLKLTEP